MRYFTFLFAFVFIVILSSCSGNKFTAKEKQLISHSYNNGIMPLMQVSNTNDSVVLYKKSKDIKPDSNNKYLTQIVKNLHATVYDTNNPGVGIAAPQVGVNRRIIIVKRFDKDEKPMEYFLNSQIIVYSESQSEGREGCLSVPGYRGYVIRADTIVINYDLLNKQNITDTISGFTAIIFQHEIDHLEGVLYTDRIEDEEKLTRTID